MTYYAGKVFTVKVGDGAAPEVFTTVAAAKSHSLSINNEAIDVTNKDGNQFRALINGGIKSLEISLSGIMTDDTTIAARMMTLATGTDNIANFHLVSGLGDKFAGPFFVQSLERSGEVNNAETYSFKLSSAGTIVYTAAP